MISILIISALVGIALVSFRQAALSNQLLLSKIESQVVAEGVVLSDPILKTGQVIGYTESLIKTVLSLNFFI